MSVELRNPFSDARGPTPTPQQSESISVPGSTGYSPPSGVDSSWRGWAETVGGGVAAKHGLTNYLNHRDAMPDQVLKPEPVHEQMAASSPAAEPQAPAPEPTPAAPAAPEPPPAASAPEPAPGVAEPSGKTYEYSEHTQHFPDGTAEKTVTKEWHDHGAGRHTQAAQRVKTDDVGGITDIKRKVHMTEDAPNTAKSRVEPEKPQPKPPPKAKAAPAGESAAKAEPKAKAEAPKAKPEPKAAPKAEAAAKKVKMSPKEMTKDIGKKAARGTLNAAKGAGAAGLRGLNLARLGMGAVPFFGTAIAVASWVLDKEGRKMVNDFVSTVVGPGSPPAIGAPPEPPRTHFLPLTHDGNRDPSIVRMDQGMVKTNTAALGFDPEQVWHPTSPAITNMPDFSSATHAFGNLASATGDWATTFAAQVQALSGTGDTLTTLRESTASLLPTVRSLGEDIIPGLSKGVQAAAATGDNFYQQFRTVNAMNRNEISNSTTGLIPFRPNHIDEGAMSDSVRECQNALGEMNALADKISSVPQGWSVAAPAVPGGDGKADHAREAGHTNLKPALTSLPKHEDAKSPLDADKLKDAIRNNLPSMPSVPSAPMSAPGGGGMPMGGGSPMGGGMPSGAGMPAPASDPAAKRDPEDLKDLLDKKNRDEKDKDAEDEEPGTTPGKDKAKGAKPGEDEKDAPEGTTREIGGVDRSFANPKAATLASVMGMPGDKSIDEAVADSGLARGERVERGQETPGDMVRGPMDRGVYLGNDEVVTETGEIKQLGTVLAGATGEDQGIFHLVDAPAEAPVEAPAGPSMSSLSDLMPTAPEPVEPADEPTTPPPPVPQGM